MSPQNRNSNQGGNQGGQRAQGSNGSARPRRKSRRRGKAKPADLWRAVPQLPDPEPIVPAADPGLLLRSLGSPPLHGQGEQAGHTFELVAMRSSMMAAALAATAGLLATDDDEAGDG